MCAQWARFPWKDALFANADETILRQAPAAAENVFANAAGGFSRFPGLTPFVSLPNTGRVFPYRWRNYLVAATDSGRIFRIGSGGEIEDATGTPLSGGQRPIFAGTEEELCIAAGGPIIRLASGSSEQLADGAPNSTHVAFVDGYVVAIEPHTGRFWHSDPGQGRVWNPLSVFTAEAKPDDLNACVVTPYRELLFAGVDSIEQWERLSSGDKPFYRRWSTGEGLAHPYTLVSDVTGNYGVNDKLEFVRFQAQVSREQSDAIAFPLEAIDDWTDAWADMIAVGGQRFVLLQAPKATTYYGGKGATFLLDIREKKWSFLYGWDEEAGLPARWPGWSLARAWGRTFVGLDNGIAELKRGVTENLTRPQRCLIRSAHVGEFGSSRLDNLRLRFKRGTGPYEGVVPRVGVRMIRDNQQPTEWSWQELGRPGDNDLTKTFGGFGCAYTWQMEIVMTDPSAFEFTEAWVLVERLGW